MKVCRIPALLFWCVAPWAVAAQAGEIPSQERTVKIAQFVEPPCLSIRTPHEAIIHLQRAPLEDAATATPDQASRLSRTRAQTLLASMKDAQPDARGCMSVALTDLPQDSRYLLGDMIEEGRAAISISASAGLAASVVVKDLNPRCAAGPMGARTYRLDNERPLLMLITCVT
ncbi:hypothetical protein [Pseudoxanthomonas sp.]|uniref:hypothetical protein n=1 Tax=Pseudoxanthomonas sp. TaxID=1871049 RepID=UPI00261EECC6|nr:hypothetical protein [Pseudoxanthomonas sp.]WDS36016.1 MAG: hypothetical protein O8I58_17200 [Pseudoxanthomonas sp.]